MEPPINAVSEPLVECAEPRPGLAARLGGLGPLLWLVVFSATGIMLGMSFELLDLHAGPAKELTFLLPLLGYWAQLLVGGFWVARCGSWRQGRWTRPMVVAIVGSAVFDGAAQALDYAGQMQGGYTLFTIFHASVTLFACIIAALTLRARPSPLQWAGALCIVAGLLATAFPHLGARLDFGWAFLFSLVGSFCLAASYPLSEAFFRLAGDAPPSEEMGCVVGSLFNVVAFSGWTLAYTMPRWQADVVAPIANSTSPCEGAACAVGYYGLFALMVGLHSLSFWKSVHRLGTVPTAVSKGAQQAGIFVCAHVFFCSTDEHECLWRNGRGTSAWSHWQKPTACLLCVAGCVAYVLGKPQRATADEKPLEVATD